MNKFFKSVFSSCLGALLAMLVIGLIIFIWAGRMASTSHSAKTVGPNSVLHLTLEKSIPEKTNNVGGNNFEFSSSPTLGLFDIKRAIEKAKADKNIKGILLEPKFMGMGKSTGLVLRRALEDFSESGKFVYSMSDVLSQDGYYLSSVADSIFLHPIGGIDFRGFSAMIPFFKDMLDRLGVKMQVIYAGKFKSATEPFRRNDISPENRLQLTEYINDRYDLFVDDIARSRNMESDEIRRIANEFLLRKPQDAVELGLADNIKYRDEVYKIIKDKIGLDEKKDLNLVKLKNYFNPKLDIKDQSAKDKIAVVFAEGEIRDNNKDQGVIDGEKYAKMIREIRKDKGIKAMVLRVNSPGGSVLASDKIRREVLACKEAGLPVVISMGDLAASGGYYIAADGDSIFAEPNTLTGSIGVFGVLPSFQKMMSSKLGVRFDTVSTGQYSSSYTTFFDMSNREFEIVQQMVEQTYDDFLTVVSEGRGMSKEAVNEIAQGRVWTGKRAVELGLVDKLGNLEDALGAAADLAGIKDYKVREWPKTKTVFEQIMAELSNGDLQVDALLDSKLKNEFPEYEMLEGVINTKGVQARLPFIIN